MEYYTELVSINPEWQDDPFWEGSDWQEAFGDLDTQGILRIYNELYQSLSQKKVHADEVTYMREMLAESGYPTHNRSVVHHLMTLKLSHLRWLESEITRRQALGI